MAEKWKFTLPEILDIADRMIKYGQRVGLDEEMKKDCLTVGVLLARLIERGQIKNDINLND